jgi:hypothetical protein
MLLALKWHLARDVPEYRMIPTVGENINTTSKFNYKNNENIFLTLLAFLVDLDHCPLIHEHIIANKHDLSTYIGSHFI